MNSLQDDQQYPAACCNKTNDIPSEINMYGKTASSGIESMNRANEETQGRMAIDLLNAAIVLLKMEGDRYVRAQSNAHKDIMEKIFDNCDPSIYRLQMTEHPDNHTFVCSKKSATMREYVVIIPKVGSDHGSRFGSCTCGFPKKEGIPCDHMVAIVKLGAVANLTWVD
jgi:hypothetical protein